MGSAAANWNYFARADVAAESTFIIGLTPADPTLQIMDSTDNADANMSASKRAISVEVVGDGVGPYTAWQISELTRIGRWAASTHPIERRIIPSEAASGFGWHVMFGAPGPWTSVRGKVCPGNARIAQLRTTVFPAIFAGTPTATAQEVDMLADERKALFEIAANSNSTNGAVGRLEVAVSDKASGLLTRTAQLEGKVAGLVTALNQIKGGGNIDQSAIDAAAERGAAAFGEKLAEALQQ